MARPLVRVDVGRSVQTGSALAAAVAALFVTGVLLSPTLGAGSSWIAAAQERAANTLYVAHVAAGAVLALVVLVHLLPVGHAFSRKPGLSTAMYVASMSLLALVLVETITGVMLWAHVYAFVGKEQSVRVHLVVAFLVLLPFGVHFARGVKVWAARRAAADSAVAAAAGRGKGEAAVAARGRVTRRAFLRFAGIVVAGLAVAAAVGRFTSEQVMMWRLNSVGNVPPLTKENWRLKVTGLVAKPVELDWDAFRRLPQTELRFTHRCVEGWTYTDTFTGVALPHVLALAGGVTPGAKQLVFRSPEVSTQRIGRGQLYTTNFPVEDGLHDDVLLVHQAGGKDLPPDHGFPVRLMTPRKWGYKACKWLTEIEVSGDASYRGYWERFGYHNDGDYPGPIFAPGRGR